METKQQVVVVHGGDTFETYGEYISFLKKYEVSLEYFKKRRWRENLQDVLGDDFEVIAPAMPNKSNAQYLEWKIWFEKLFPFLDDSLILIGHSLGGAFVAKYLSENRFPKKLKAVLLVAAVYDKDTEGYGLATFSLPKEVDLQTDKICLYHSKDDFVVPFDDVNRYKEALPNAEVKIFEDRGHFATEEFPEIVEDIKSIAKK